MRVIFTINAAEHSFEIAEEDDLALLAAEIEEHLRQEHDLLRESAWLPIAVADGVLNSLADDGEQVELGELVQTEHTGSRPTGEF